MAIAGPTLSERDRKEFNLMIAEKKTALAQEFQAMTTQTVRASQSLAASYLRSMWSPTPSAWPAPCYAERCPPVLTARNHDCL
jgi:hypothetical protein